MNKSKIYLLLIFGLVCVSCSSRMKGNIGNMPTYNVPSQEAEWIRNGESIEFEDEVWVPQDEIMILLDSEVLLLGKFKDVQFFVSKEDVRPFNRLFTKFGANKFRIYERKIND